MQLHSGLSYDNKSLVSVSVETQNFETKIFWIFIYGKNAYHTISSYGKNACHTISVMQKMLILLFSYAYFCSKKLYERV